MLGDSVINLPAIGSEMDFPPLVNKSLDGYCEMKLA